MKNLLLLFTFFSIAANSFAQTEPAEERLPSRHELQVNATTFANQFLSFNDNNAAEGDYILAYKLLGPTTLRLGLGLRAFSTTEEESGNSPEVKNSLLETKFRIGLETQYPVGKRWIFTFGGDLPIGFRQSKVVTDSDFEEVTITTNTSDIGLGPVMGFQFKINDRITLGTESAMYFEYFLQTDKIKSEFFENDSDKTRGYRFDIAAPTALYFGIRF